nr:integrase, catalytic region, zinc finger, CCHC-type, peptidase aspartic, catalytic [Tanacetum cinerariifolium]
MGDEHLDIIPAMESNEFIKSCVENLVPNPSESEGENGCDVPACFTTFSNVLFDADYESNSSDYQSYIRLIERLLYDNSSPRTPEEFVSENSNAEIESFSSSPIPFEDSDSHMEEIDLSFNPDNPMPPGIEEDDDDSERDILILEELPRNYSFSLPVNESFHFDIPLFSRPPAKPPDGNTRILNIKMMGDISDQKVKDKQEKTKSEQNRTKTGSVEEPGNVRKEPINLSSVSHLKLNKDVKRYSRKDLLSCNNFHLRETSSAYVCNDAMNVSCNSRLCDSFDENNLFIFDDESIRISPVSKMPFRKKSRDSLNVRSKRNSNQPLPRTMHRWLPKMQLLAEPIAKWIPRIVQIYLWIIDSGCSKHMTGNRALLLNFVEKFHGTIRFGNNDFAVIAGYEDVVIGSMTIKKVYYVEGLGNNIFSVGQFCDKGLEVAFRKSTYFVRNEDGVDLLTGDRSSNLYTIALNEVASNSSTCLLAKCCLLNDYEDVGKLKSKRDIGVFVGYAKESAAFRIYNKQTRMIDESVNVNFDEISEMASKQFSLEPRLSNLNETGKSSNPSIMKSSTTNVETSNDEIPSNEEEVFHESSESFQKESYSSSLNDDV